MRINFLVNEVFNGWEPTDTRLGGTERGVVEWAEELVKRGCQVIIWRNPTNNQVNIHNGVIYRDRDNYFACADVCVNVKSPENVPLEPTIYYTNEIDANLKDLSAYDAVIHISNWAKKHIPIRGPRVFVVPHGYDDTKIFSAKKNPRQVLYASSPDRGLDILLRAWPEVVRAHPDATLLVTYGVEGPEYKGIEYLGDCDEDTMNELYRTSDIWAYPCTGIELQCITGLKAQAAGCWPVIIPHMALSETVKYGTFTDKEHFADKLIEALSGHPPTDRTPKPGLTIKESTDKLLGVIDFIYNKGSN